MEYHVYWLLKSSCFELFGDGKYDLFFSQKVDGKMIFTWSFWAFHDIPGVGKYGFSCSGGGDGSKPRISEKSMGSGGGGNPPSLLPSLLLLFLLFVPLKAFNLCRILTSRMLGAFDKNFLRTSFLSMSILRILRTFYRILCIERWNVLKDKL